MWNWIKRIFGYKQKSVVAPIKVSEIIDEPGYYLGNVTGHYQSEVPMIKGAVELLNKVTRSPHFQDEVMRARFTNTNGKTNEQIYKDFTTKPIVINVAMFTGSFMQNRVYKTVGYDSATDEYVHVNRYFVKDPSTLASLMVHECAHALGFSHTSASESTSIPYSMNGIFERVLNKLEEVK